MDLQDQLKNLFPDHVPAEEPAAPPKTDPEFWVQDDHLLCKYEKRRGKPTTIIAGYNGTAADFKLLAKQIKQLLSVGGGIKDEQIIIQGDYRDKIMEFLKAQGFNVKRVGG